MSKSLSTQSRGLAEWLGMSQPLRLISLDQLHVEKPYVSAFPKLAKSAGCFKFEFAQGMSGFKKETEITFIINIVENGEK